MFSYVCFLKRYKICILLNRFIIIKMLLYLVLVFSSLNVNNLIKKFINIKSYNFFNINKVITLCMVYIVLFLFLRMFRIII